MKAVLLCKLVERTTLCAQSMNRDLSNLRAMHYLPVVALGAFYATERLAIRQRTEWSE